MGSNSEKKIVENEFLYKTYSGCKKCNRNKISKNDLNKIEKKKNKLELGNNLLFANLKVIILAITIILTAGYYYKIYSLDILNSFNVKKIIGSNINISDLLPAFSNNQSNYDENKN